MSKFECGSVARFAAAAGLGLTLALGAAPVVAVAEGAGGSTYEPHVSPKGQEPSGEGIDNDAGVTPSSETVVTMKHGDLESEYSSFAEALEEVGKYDYKTNKDVYTISLEKDVVEDVVIPGGVNVTIDLAGHKLTNKSGHTVTNNSTRTKIVDSVGGGIIDNVMHGRGAVYNNINASITLEGGTFTRSAEASTGAGVSGNNSWYVLKNFGTMTIKDGVTVKFSEENPGYYSSLIGNGWQNSSAAESGSSSEPKPSDGNNKATLTINGGTFIGGKITVKNDDYGILRLTGGSISQNTDNYYAIFNANDATISGGTITAVSDAIGSQHYDGTANAGSLVVEGGAITSRDGSAVALLGGAKGTIKGGTFSPGDGGYAIAVDDDSSATISAGTFRGTTADKVVNKEGSFADRYGVVEDGEGNLVAVVTDAVATVTAVDGTVTGYETLSKALSNAPAGSTVTLQEDVELTSTVSTANFGVTVDLNGHNVSSSATSAVIQLNTKYSNKPVEGLPTTMRLINSVPGEGGVVSGQLPLSAKSGDSTYSLGIEIGEGVTLSPTDSSANAIKLESSAYLLYSEQTASYFKNGGFRVAAEDGDRIYGSYANAAGVPVDGVVTLLNDYTGNEQIKSGGHSSALDLAGHTYTYTGTSSIVDINYDGAALTITDGALKASNACDGITMVCSGSSVTLDGVSVEVPGGSYGIVTNGTYVDNAITLRNSSLAVANGAGIYFPSTGHVLIDNSSITAKYTGVQICAGSLKVQGDQTSITVTGTPESKVENDGVIADGAAVSVVDRAGYQELGTVSIVGGTFKSAEGVGAIKAYSFSNDNKNEADWPGAGTVVAVSGGSFSSAVPEDLCADGLEPIDDGNGSHTVGIAEANVATISDSAGNVIAAYESIQDALSSAAEGQTVTLLEDVEVNSQVCVATQGVAINGDGHKVTYVGDAPIDGTYAFEGGLLNVVADDVTISNLLIDTRNNVKHGVQFYESEGGSLSGCTVNGGTYTSVIVNGSKVTITDCALNPSDGAYANIEYAMGKNAITIPEITVNSLTFGRAEHQVWVDGDTVARVQSTISGGASIDDVMNRVDENIANLGKTDIRVDVAVDGGFRTIVVEGEKDNIPSTPSGDAVKVEQSEGGTVKVTPTRADEGDEVTIAATPDEGREVRSVTVTDEDGKSVTVKAGEKDGEYVFEMPDGAVTVTVTFGCDGGGLCPTHGFNDVDQSAWYHDAVDWAVTEGVLNGYGEGGESLGPVADVTRAEMAQMLWNRAGRPEATADLSAFTDVDAGGWYAPALEWCVSEGIFSGYGDTFGTERTISREEAVTVLWRLAGSPEADADLSAFGDETKVSDYATGAIKWAVANGVLTGKGNVALDPQAGCTRGEVAAMMMRMTQ